MSIKPGGADVSGEDSRRPKALLGDELWGCDVLLLDVVLGSGVSTGELQEASVAVGVCGRCSFTVWVEELEDGWLVRFSAFSSNKIGKAGGIIL